MINEPAARKSLSSEFAKVVASIDAVVDLFNKLAAASSTAAENSLATEAALEVKVQDPQTGVLRGVDR
jgi:hypothetical protein